MSQPVATSNNWVPTRVARGSRRNFEVITSFCTRTGPKNDCEAELLEKAEEISLTKGVAPANTSLLHFVRLGCDNHHEEPLLEISYKDRIEERGIQLQETTHNGVKRTKVLFPVYCQDRTLTMYNTNK